MNYYLDNPSIKFYLSHAGLEKIITLKEDNFTNEEQNDIAPCNVNDAIENYDIVLSLVGELAANVIESNAESVDSEGVTLENNHIKYAHGTLQNHQTMRDAGLYGMALPRRYNGLNFPYVPYIMAAEMVSRADASFANIWGLQDCAGTIVEFASEEIKKRYLPLINEGFTCSMDLTEPESGSDLQSIKLQATYDNQSECWRLNGVKRFITNGDADIKLVLARTEEGTNDGRGLSLFLYDRRDGGLTIRRIEKKMGIKGSPTAELVFNNAPAIIIGERRLGLIKYVMSLMNCARLGVGAQSVGISEAAYQEAIKYAMQREQFGKPIISFPQVNELISNIRAKTDAIRSLLYETTRQVDLSKAYEATSHKRCLSQTERNDMKRASLNANMLTPLLKLISSEFANQNTYDCIQVHGGSGYMQEYKCERLYRDARVLTIYEGTSQLQVVAATRFVGNGAYLKLIDDYERLITDSELTPLLERLKKIRGQYENFDSRAIEYHSRRFVESLGYIIMGHLLLQDSQKDRSFLKSCEKIINTAEAEIAKNQIIVKLDNQTD